MVASVIRRCRSNPNSTGLSSLISVMARNVSSFCSNRGSYVRHSLSRSSWYGSAPLGLFKNVDSFFKAAESNFDSTYQYYVFESVTPLSPKFASARANQASGSDRSNVGNWTAAPNTAAASKGIVGPAWPFTLLVAMATRMQCYLREGERSVDVGEFSTGAVVRLAGRKEKISYFTKKFVHQMNRCPENHASVGLSPVHFPLQRQNFQRALSKNKHIPGELLSVTEITLKLEIRISSKSQGTLFP